MTVSYALRGNSRISEARRKQIKDIAEEMGYRPDPEISKMMSYLRKSREVKYQSTLILLTNGMHESCAKVDVYSKRFYEGVCKRADELGYKLEEFWMGQKGMTGARAEKIFHARGIQGIIIPPCFYNPEIPDIDWSRFVVVSNLVHPAWEKVHRVVPHQFNNAKKALENLSDYSPEEILFCSTDKMETLVNQQFLSAYLWYMHKFGGGKAPAPLVHGYLNYLDELKKAIAKYNPKVLFVTEDFIIDMLTKDMGLRIPEDVRVVLPGVNAHHDWGVDERPDIQGRCVVDILAMHLQHNQIGFMDYPSVMMVDGEWRGSEGETAS